MICIICEKNEAFTNHVACHECEQFIDELKNKNEPIKILHATIDDKKISYSSQTEFLVQVGRNKSAYKTRYSFTGNLAQAIMYYKGINIGNGYKKRLFVPSFNKPVLARQFS